MNERSQVIVVHADDPNGKRRNRLEVYGRRWAATQGVPVPRVIDHDPEGRWLVSERAHGYAPKGPEYLDAALESANRIAAGTPPRPQEVATTWRHPHRWKAPLRALQLAAGGVSPATFIAARRAVAALPPEVPSHCDFHIGNVLFTRRRADGIVQAATIIDFEYLRMGPRHADAIRLFTTVESHQDAAHGVDVLLRGTTANHWPAIAVQLRWLALRPLAELLTVEGGPDPELLSRARERWRLAQQWVRDIERAQRTPVRRDSASAFPRIATPGPRAS
ncbi:MAG: phosphotransferase [Tessaracoccus sp.]